MACFQPVNHSSVCIGLHALYKWISVKGPLENKHIGRLFCLCFSHCAEIQPGELHRRFHPKLETADFTGVIRITTHPSLRNVQIKRIRSNYQRSSGKWTHSPTPTIWCRYLLRTTMKLWLSSRSHSPKPMMTAPHSWRTNTHTCCEYVWINIL